MNYSEDDIHRSLRRYVAEALDGWKVWTQREEVRDAERPIAIVEPASPTTTTFARSTVPQGDISRARAFSAQAYPELSDTARESRLAASIASQALGDAITYGLVVTVVDPDTDEETVVPIGGPRKIPIYDYSDVALAGDPAARRGPPEPYGYADVAEGWAVNTIQDPLDHLRFTVALDVRLSWWAGGRIVTDPIAATMPSSETVH